MASASGRAAKPLRSPTFTYDGRRQSHHGARPPRQYDHPKLRWRIAPHHPDRPAGEDDQLRLRWPSASVPRPRILPRRRRRRYSGLRDTDRSPGSGSTSGSSNSSSSTISLSPPFRKKSGVRNAKADRPGHENDRAFYCEAWNGTSAYTYDRIGRGTLHIRAACLSVLGGLQPGPLERYLREVFGGRGHDGSTHSLLSKLWSIIVMKAC